MPFLFFGSPVELYFLAGNFGNCCKVPKEIQQKGGQEKDGINAEVCDGSPGGRNNRQSAFHIAKRALLPARHPVREDWAFSPV